MSAEDNVHNRIERILCGEVYNNFVCNTFERAKTTAENSNESDALYGLTFAVKDNFDVAGSVTACASRALHDNIAQTDARAVTLLERAGACLLGKTNMDELAMGSTDTSSAFGCVRNFNDITRVPGGSSGGSANAVAAGQADFALGTDTGGSVRQPAAFCGVVGLKPTFGAVDTAGIAGAVSSLDTVGIFSETCAVAYKVFGVLTGGDAGELRGFTRGVTLGIADEFMNDPRVSGGVYAAFADAAALLEKAGAKLVRVSLPSFCSALSVYHILSSAEAALRLTGRLGGFPDCDVNMLGAEVKRRIMTGMTVLSGERYDGIYMRALAAKSLIKREFMRALSQCDMLISPAAPTVAVKIDDVSDPHAVHGSDMFLCPVSLAGLPAASVPCGVCDGLPVGMQIIGGVDSEREILSVGAALEKARLG